MSARQKPWSSAAARRLKDLAGNARTVEEAVEVVAARLLDGIACPPTNLDDLKNRLNVKAFEAVSGMPVSGELRKDGDSFVVAYAASLSPGRRRFTIAHELGHAVFETTGPSCPRFGKELERLCDMLAAEFLFPRKVFTEHAGAELQPLTVYELARKFDASVMATALRCHKVLGASVFQVEKGKVAWGFGAIRHQRDLSADTHTFRRAIGLAMEGTPGEESVFLGRSKQLLQWIAVAGQERALFLMQRQEHRREVSRGRIVERGCTN